VLVAAVVWGPDASALRAFSIADSDPSGETGPWRGPQASSTSFGERTGEAIHFGGLSIADTQMRGGVRKQGATGAAPLTWRAVKGARCGPGICLDRAVSRLGASGHALHHVRGVRVVEVKASARDSSTFIGTGAAGVSDVGEGLGDVEWRRDFKERFVVGDVIGEGQQGLVREVVSRDTGRVAAVKVLARDAGVQSRSEESKVRSEARFLQRLQSCPAVARMFGAYEDDEHVYIVMELIDAGSMEDVLEEVERFTEEEAAYLMCGVFGFLAHSHDEGIFYGDVKPANFMLRTAPCQDCAHRCTSGRLRGLVVKAIDFGTCQQRIPGVHFRKRAGSPMYMAPEVFLGRYDVEADLWSAGVMLFQLLSGRLPFVEYGDAGEIVDVGVHLGFSFEGIFWEGVSSEAKDLITKLLVRIPRKRLSAKAALDHSWFKYTLEHMEGRKTGMEESSIVAAPGIVAAEAQRL